MSGLLWEGSWKGPGLSFEDKEVKVIRKGEEQHSRISGSSEWKMKLRALEGIRKFVSVKKICI